MEEKKNWSFPFIWNIDELNHKYNSFKSFGNSIYLYNFIIYIQKYYPQSYKNLQFDEIIIETLEINDYLNNLYEEINKNRIIDILIRLSNLQSDSFSFAKFANIIIEKTEQTIKSIKNTFPPFIKDKIKEDLDILLNSQNNNNNLNDLNKSKYNLIFNLYQIFKN